MAAIVSYDIDGHCRDARHCCFKFLQLSGKEAAHATRVVPARMLVVSKDELCADSRNFPCRLCRLRVAQITEELNCPGESFSQGAIFGTVCFKFKHVENLATRCNKPAKRICQRKSNTLPLPVIKLIPFGVGGLLQMRQRP